MLTFLFLSFIASFALVIYGTNEIGKLIPDSSEEKWKLAGVIMIGMMLILLSVASICMHTFHLKGW